MYFMILVLFLIHHNCINVTRKKCEMLENIAASKISMIHEYLYGFNHTILDGHIPFHHD